MNSWNPVCAKTTLLLKQNGGLRVPPPHPALGCKLCGWGVLLIDRKSPSNVRLPREDLDIGGTGNILPGMFGDRESPEGKPWLLIL